MNTELKPKRSIWTLGLQSEEPTDTERAAHAAELSQRFGVEIVAPPIPRVEELELRPPRIEVPTGFEDFCCTGNYERAVHSYSADDRHPAVFGHFPNPPDVVAHPRNEPELERVLEWCDSKGYVAIPFGGGSSVVGGVTPPEADAVVTVDMDRFDTVLEIDETSRAARTYRRAFSAPNSKVSSGRTVSRSDTFPRALRGRHWAGGLPRAQPATTQRTTRTSTSSSSRCGC